MNQTILAGALSAVSLSLAAPAFAGPVLDKVKANDVVVCGVNTAAPGNKVKFVPLNSPQRFSALQAGEVDVLARNTTWNLTRDASLGAVFVGTNYYDGQGFLVPKKLNVKSAKQLNGATICVQSGTSSEPSVADYFKSHGMKY